MHPHIVFWVSAIVRLAVVAAISACISFFWGTVPGLISALLCVLALITVQLYYLLHLSDWLDNPSSARLPDGEGAWSDVFSRLYRLRRGHEKINPNSQNG